MSWGANPQATISARPIMSTHPLEAFHVMAKPTGARCNLDCAYCFFLKKEPLYPDSTFRMSDEVHGGVHPPDHRGPPGAAR